MEVFISWSGEQSESIAKVLRRWLPLVLPYVVPTSRSSPGELWRNGLHEDFQNARFAVLCVTRNNLQAPWLVYEAGALSHVRVCPFLIDIDQSELKEPLSGLQASKAEFEPTFSMLEMMDVEAETPVGRDILSQRFHTAWPLLDKAISSARQIAPNDKREAHSMVDSQYPPLPVLGERRSMTSYYIERAGSAGEVDIITLTMSCVLEFYKNERLLSWIRDGGLRMRVLVLAPNAWAAVVRGIEEGHPSIGGKILQQIDGPIHWMVEQALSQIQSGREFSGRLEIRWYDLLPYFAYFRADKEIALGLYYTHLPGLDSESLAIGDDSPMYKKLTHHFEALWTRRDGRVGPLCTIAGDIAIMSQHLPPFGQPWLV